jgi:hypothetical protein
VSGDSISNVQETTALHQRSHNMRDGGAHTWNMPAMPVTELVIQVLRGWLKAVAAYSAGRNGWPCGVRGEL